MLIDSSFFFEDTIERMSMIGEELLSVERREVVALKPKGRWFKSNDPLV